MTQLERLYQLNSSLLNEMTAYKKQALSLGKTKKPVLSISITCKCTSANASVRSVFEDTERISASRAFQ